MKKLVSVMLTMVMVIVLAACSSNKEAVSSPSTNPSTDKSSAVTVKPAENVELSMWMFTGTGLEPLIKKYQEIHTNVKIKIQQQEYGDHHNGLVTALAAAKGAPDVALVEIGYIDKFKADESKFYNLADYGANEIMGNYLAWKKVQASSKDGNFIFGIPTDVGPMAMMYRTDLFQKAGLSTAPADVSKLISTWDQFIQVGKTIKEKTGKPMIYGVDDLYQVIRGQAKEQYFDKDGKFIADTNPAIKRAYDITAQAAQAGLSAKIGAWSPEWGAGMNKGDFAVLLGPSWMVGFMKANAPDSSGKWNVAAMPEGSGNWGGSFLTMPKEGKHPNEAFAFISWLLAPEQQLELFKETGSNFPSTPSVYKDPIIQNYTDVFFQNAPLGKIFADAAEKVEPVYFGPDYIVVDTPIQQALGEVDKNKADPTEAWNKAIKQINRELKK
jgi:cellobiose transport system substrate-binding protein